MLLPEARTTATLVEHISEDVYRACREIGVTVIGGHTEITAKLDRPILVGTLIGEVDRGRLVTPQGAQAGDRVLLTKGVPIELFYDEPSYTGFVLPVDKYFPAWALNSGGSRRR